ncbi:MAG: hypothetical protein Q9160_003098 [Pyrenula sp. 1 TL-2023]
MQRDGRPMALHQAYQEDNRIRQAAEERQGREEAAQAAVQRQRQQQRQREQTRTQFEEAAERRRLEQMAIDLAIDRSLEDQAAARDRQDPSPST